MPRILTDEEWVRIAEWCPHTEGDKNIWYTARAYKALADRLQKAIVEEVDCGSVQNYHLLQKLMALTPEQALADISDGSLSGKIPPCDGGEGGSESLTSLHWGRERG